jgi:hypothetical protein
MKCCAAPVDGTRRGRARFNVQSDGWIFGNGGRSIMSRYHFNLAGLDLQSKRLCSLHFKSLRAAETAAVLYAKAVVRRTAEDHIREGWLEVQDGDGVVRSVVSIGAQSLPTSAGHTGSIVPLSYR